MERVARAEPQIGDLLHLTLEGMGRFGETLASVEGRAVSVFGGIPGERVTAEVVRRGRGHTAARVTEVLEPSPHRVTPPCPYFWPCTGCQWQHISYDHQLELKRRIVQADLAASPALADVEVRPTLPSPQSYGYRNHARMTVGPRGTLGFVNRTTRRFLQVERCMLMDPWINDAIGGLQGHAAETTQLSVRYGVNTGQWLVQPRLVDPGVTFPTGQKHYEEALLGRSFRVASPSFFQVNTPQAEAMVRLVERELGSTGADLLVDAYAGVATFAVLLAPSYRRVVAIEESAAAVRDGEANAAGLSNVTFRQGRTETVLASLEETPDAVILDPPRAGCHPRAIEALNRLVPPRVVYVSCEPETLARDLALLTAGPYRVEQVQPIDLFPQTHHIECIATLVLKDAAPKGIVLASTSPRRRDLLEDFGLPFRVEAPEVSEEAEGRIGPVDLARALALRKADAVADRVGGTVLGADTLVVLDGTALGKPSDAEEARVMLRALRGRTHQVVTAVAVVDRSGSPRVAHCVSDVAMRDYTDAEIEAYVASGAPLDKAGAYAVQDPGFRPAEAVVGCSTNVIGLPMCVATALLREAGVDARPRPGWRPLGECRACAALAGQDGGRA